MEEFYFNKFFLESDDLGYMLLLWKFHILVFKQTHKIAWGADLRTIIIALESHGVQLILCAFVKISISSTFFLDLYSI